MTFFLPSIACRHSGSPNRKVIYLLLSTYYLLNFFIYPHSFIFFFLHHSSINLHYLLVCSYPLLCRPRVAPAPRGRNQQGPSKQRKLQTKAKPHRRLNSTPCQSSNQTPRPKPVRAHTGVKNNTPEVHQLILSSYPELEHLFKKTCIATSSSSRTTTYR